jgi:hypothetical protein
MAKELAALPEIITVPDPSDSPPVKGPIDLDAGEPPKTPEQQDLFEEPSSFDEAPVQKPVEVAGLVSDIILPIARKVKEFGEKGEVLGPRASDAPIERAGDLFIVRQASDAEVDSFNRILGVTEGKPPSVSINYDRHIGAGNDLATFDRISEVMKDYIERQKRGSVTFLETIQAAEAKIKGGIVQGVKEKIAGVTETVARVKKQGNIDGILDLLFKRNIGQPINAEDLIAGRMALDVINRDVSRLANSILAGTATEADKVQFRQAMSLEGAAMASLLGGRAEAARTTAAGRIITDISEGRADEISRLLTEGGDNTVEWLAQRYAILPTQESKAKFSRNILGKAASVWQSIFLNAYISGLSTQSVNITGNFAFGVLQIVERLGAEVIGGTRRAITGDTTGVQRGEAIEMIFGLVHSTPNALRLMVKTLIENQPQSGGLATKLDIKSRNPISGDNLLPDSVKNFGIGPYATVGRAIDGLGFTFGLPGRLLLTADEGFKAWNANAQFEALALRRMRLNVKNGMSEADAKLQHELDLRNPPVDMINGAREYAEVSTFTNDLEGILGNLQVTMNHPIAKVAVPFYKTPVNLFSRTGERAGPLALLSPTFWKNATSSDAAIRDLAMSRIAIGSTIMAGFAMFSGGDTFDDEGNVIDDTIITGSGPTARGSRDAFDRQKLQPYSVCSRTGGVEFECVSFARFDPISGLLAIAADFKEYARYSNDPEELETLAMAASLAAENYIEQLPMLSGMTKLLGALGRKDSDGLFLPGFIDTLAEMTASTVLEPGMAIGTSGTNFSSFIASIERMQDPTVRDSTPDPNMPMAIRGFYKALNKAKSRNWFYNKDVPPRLTLFGEIMKVGKGRGYETFSPIKTSTARFNHVDKEIQRLNFFVGGRLTMNTFKTVNGVKLNTLQRNTLIRATNSEENAIGGNTMIMAFSDLIDTDRYQSTLSNDEKVKELNDIITTYKGAAGDAPDGGVRILLDGDIDLEEQVNFNDLPASEQRALRDQGLAPGGR